MSDNFKKILFGFNDFAPVINDEKSQVVSMTDIDKAVEKYLLSNPNPFVGGQAATPAHSKWPTPT